MKFIEIYPIPALKDNYIWAIYHQNSRQAWVVDPGEAPPVFDFLMQRNLDLIGILVTHHHLDHTSGIDELKAKFDVPVIGPLEEDIKQLTRTVTEDDEVTLETFNLNFKVIAIPGHTRGHIAYYTPGMIFCGDTLFAAGCGRLFEGSAEQLFASLQKLIALPDASKIYCAHEYTFANLRFANLVEPSNPYVKERLAKIEGMRKQSLVTLPSTVLEEKMTNPFLRCHVPELINNVENHVGKELKTPLEVFAELRKWKDTFS